MAVLIDTTDLSPRESADAVHATLTSAATPASVEVAPGTTGVVEGWRIGTGLTLLSTRYSAGLAMRRTTRHVRADAPERISLTLGVRGECETRQVGRVLRRENQLHLLDLTAAYESRWPGPSAAVAVLADCADLGFPVDVVRRAIPALATSPLYGLTRRHLRDLPAVARQAMPGPALAALGSAGRDLIRALIASSVPGDPHSRTVRAQSLRAVLDAAIDANLHDPGLTPARIAAEHGVSLRYLYRLFADEAESPAEAIWRRRLEGARRELADRATPHTRISVTARRWGFTDPRHFARRFRAAYGITPGEWLRRHLGDT